MNKFKFVMFDLDGTLLNTLEDLADSVNSALRLNGYPEHEYTDFYNIIGKGAHNLIVQALPSTAQDEDIISKVLEDFSTSYTANCAVKTCVYEGITEALKKIENTSVPMAVLSNKPDRYMEDIQQRYFSGIEFKAFRGKRDGVPIKPDPVGAELIASEIGMTLEDSIYIGDSSVDIQTAKNAGMFSCGVLWGFRTKEELVEFGADLIVETPKELADFIISNV